MKSLTGFFVKAWKVIVTILPVLFDLTILDYMGKAAYSCAVKGNSSLAVVALGILAAYLVLRMYGIPYRCICKDKEKKK